MSMQKLGITQYDMAFSEIFIPNASENDIYVIGTGYYDNADFDSEAIVNAYREVLRRNDALRLRIVKEKFFRLRQYVAEYSEPQVSYHTLEGGKEAFGKLCRHIVPPHIEWENSDLCRADVYTCDDGTGGIILWQHHLCSDGYTMAELIYGQLCEFYRAYKNGEQPVPPKRLFSHEDYVAKQREHMQKHGLREFFRIASYEWKYLFRYAVPVKSSPKSKPQIQHRFTLGGSEYENYLELCKKTQCSVQNVMMAIASLITTQYTKKRVFCMNAMSNGRSTYALKNTAGDITELVPVIMEVRPKLSAAEYMRDVHMRFLQSTARTPIPTLLRYSFIESVLCFCSLKMPWQSLWCEFNYLKFRQEKDAPLECVTIDERTDFMNIYIEFTETEDGLQILFQHATAIMDEKKGSEIVERFRHILSAVCANPDISVGDILQNIH